MLKDLRPLYRKIFFAFIPFMATVLPAAELYNSASSHVVNGSAENGWDSWFHAANAEIVFGGPSGSGSCFSLNPSAGAHSDIRTARMPASGMDEFIFEFDCRTMPGAEPGTNSNAKVRSYDYTGTFIGQTNIPVETTGGQWHHYSYQVTVEQDAFEIDVTFLMGPEGDASGEFRFDNVRLYREIHPLNHGIGMPENLYVIRRNTLTNAQFVVMQTLQGILAQDKPLIFIDQGDSTYIDDLRYNHGIPYTRIDSFFWFMNRYKSWLEGYVLFDFNDKPSLSAATSLCGLLNAVAVDVSLESSMQTNYGLSKIADVRGKNDKWVFDNYWHQLNRDALIVHTNDPDYHGSAYGLRDWPAAIKALDWWNSSDTYSAEVYDAVHDSSPVYGWDDGAASGELGSVELHSSHNMYQVPCDWLLNLSTYAGMASRPQPWQFTQSFRDNQQPPQKETGVHYLVFNLSDMDNILTLLSPNNFGTNSKYYANPNRGSFEMCWGMPASLIELAPSVTDYWYRNATEKDCFIAPASGMGYFYPSKFDDLGKHTTKVEHLMKKADLKAIAISDKVWPGDLTYSGYRYVGESYAAIEQARGMYYFDVNGDYARYGGKILWFDGKPLITTRYTLWDGGQYEGISRTPAQLAASINALPTDPSNPDSYSFVMVHAWSYGLDDIAETISLLDSNVKVINAEEMIEQLYLNTQTAYWPFEGSLADAFGNGNDASAQGGVEYAAAGGARLGDTALMLGREDVPLEVNTSAGSDKLLTVMFWVKPADSGDHSVISKASTASSTRGWGVYLSSDSSAEFYVGGPSQYAPVSADNAWQPGQWTHVACTFNSGVAAIYINGELKNEVSNISNTVDNSSAMLKIGGAEAVTAQFAGVLDEIAIYSRPLGQAEIHELAAKGVMPKCGEWLAGDVNNDCAVNILDAARLSGSWKQTGSLLQGDLNEDREVNIEDFNIIAENWLNTD
ncbi:hypothetical protein SMSP2_00254 [Limihaloglobus sulfuriphilus]|uniref:LamG-like jellyroll fold domain-containing protein n=1 Tax=Limihaloglobus sulfuriphilus TaxID=1851148 RepID=A0A1Q2MB85_9BACT|nr:LamG-like jellyroll fold domain-containing protein [Limihaloglobus sulfuriphilus]AQQ69920.1 hypothetical protein SMSP2_00254 [Limihaloglobus sulfuriphilus]